MVSSVQTYNVADLFTHMVNYTGENNMDDIVADYVNNFVDTNNDLPMMEIMGENKPVCAMQNVEELNMYNMCDEPINDVAPVFTYIIDQDQEETVNLGYLFQSLIDEDNKKWSRTLVEPCTLNYYWGMMEYSESEVSVYEQESSYCIAPLLDSFVPQNTVVASDINVNPYNVNLADLFASECEKTIVEESEDISIVNEPVFTYDLYATLIETEECYFMSRSTINEPCVYDLDNLLPEVELIDATVETSENNECDISIQSEGCVMETNESCVRIEAKVDYFVPLNEEPVFTQEMFTEECDVEEEEKLNLSNDSWDELEEEYEQADNTEEPYIERCDLEVEEDCKTDAKFSIFTFQEAFKAKFDDIKAPKIFEGEFKMADFTESVQPKIENAKEDFNTFMNNGQSAMERNLTALQAGFSNLSSAIDRMNFNM